MGHIVADSRITGSLLEDRFFVRPETGEIFYRRDAQKKGAHLVPAGYIKPGGEGDGGGYRIINVAVGHRKYRKVRASHLVWAWVYGEWPDHEVDHRNGRRADDRIENLRKATVDQNRTNRLTSKTRSSGFKWVTRHRGRWLAQVEAPKFLRGDGKRYFVFRQYFDSPEEAHAAAYAFACGLFGEWVNPGTMN